MTPLGTFATITAAAEAHGIDQTYGSQLARKKRKGWRYVSTASPSPSDD